MPRMMIIDTYYPDFIESVGPLEHSGYPMNYEHALKYVLNHQFGTGDFYSRHLREFGWEVQDVITNFGALQHLWALENGIPHTANDDVVYEQIEVFKPDVIFLQNLTCLGSKLALFKDRYFIAGQCSCAIRREVINDYRVIFTSFPHYLPRYNRIMRPGRMVFNPLSFEPSVLGQTDPTQEARQHDIVFVGGVGHPSHWSYGMRVLEAVAANFPDKFKWWGYGYETLDHKSPLIQCYQGPAWGRQMYDIFLNAKIVINRHGEVSDNFANNMRMYEATGCGAMLLTDNKANMDQFFDPTEVSVYNSPGHAVEQIAYWLGLPEHRAVKALAGQRRTLRDHTYRERMKTVSDTILEMLDGDWSGR